MLNLTRNVVPVYEIVSHGPPTLFQINGGRGCRIAIEQQQDCEANRDSTNTQQQEEPAISVPSTLVAFVVFGNEGQQM